MRTYRENELSVIPPMEPLLPLTDLHHRHAGVTKALGDAYLEAASVCLSRHHESPTEVRVTCDDKPDADYSVTWVAPTPRVMRAHANEIDATEAGAYGVVLAALEAHLGLVALTRAPQGSGSDYYVGEPGSEVNPTDGELDLESAVRLEVSGANHCDYLSDLYRLLREKLMQASKGRSSLEFRPFAVGHAVSWQVWR